MSNININIRIVFYKTSSRNYELCCKRCAKFNHFESKNGKNTLTAHSTEVKKKLELFESIFSVVSRWALTEYYINDGQVRTAIIKDTIARLYTERAMARGRSARMNVQEIHEKTPPTSFSDIGGIDDIIQQIREVVELPIIAPDLMSHYNLKPHKGILLYGPPGCGKTMIAKAIAHDIKAHFLCVNGPELSSKFVGQTEENLRDLFAQARSESPSIIYFDEFDSIAAKREEDHKHIYATVVNQLLTLMDGLVESTICCIASTNRLDMLDDAIKRPGRFDYIIEIGMPTLEGCKSIFNIHTAKKPVDSGFDRNAFAEKYLIGLSGADIAFVASEAAYNSIRRTVDIGTVLRGEKMSPQENNIITENDFIRAVNTLKDRKERAERVEKKQLVRNIDC